MLGFSERFLWVLMYHGMVIAYIAKTTFVLSICNRCRPRVCRVVSIYPGLALP